MSSLPVHYCFIAKDPDMVVFENFLAKELSSQTQAQRSAFRRELRDRLADLDSEASNINEGDQEIQSFILHSAPSAAQATD
jgi:hypothetical protein